MNFLFSKNKFQKIVKRLHEDSTSIWHDHLEQDAVDYQEVMENYEAIKARNYVISVEKQEQNERERLVQSAQGMKKKQITDEMEKARQYYGDIIENPSLKIPRSQQTIAHQRLYFVKQRRVMDRWGRMMLLKPNRNYYKDPSHVYYEYHKYDYLDKLLAISMIEDDDQDDLVLPQGEYKEQMKEYAAVFKGEQ